MNVEIFNCHVNLFVKYFLTIRFLTEINSQFIPLISDDLKLVSWQKWTLECQGTHLLLRFAATK